ncbi:MAG: SRPBCC family protein [Chloroflexota bacterium]
MQQFIAQQTTTASKAQIWAIWEDVTQWQQWDIELQYSRLDGAFTEGTQGTLKAKGSPESRFIITECTEGESFTYAVQLPFAKLRVAHYFLESDETTFVHEVAFTGALGWLFGRLLGETYSKALPIALTKLKEIAEQ